MWLRVAIGCLVLMTSACSTLRYYAHVARGQASLVAQRRPIASVVADPRTEPALRTRLAHSQQARAFASSHLDLPRNRSYTTYVAVARPYVTWNVLATPEFSVEPVTHCFPFAGCVAYLGFFDRTRAQSEAERLNALGNDTDIEGVAAYSTLGWFADPILSSMLRWDDDELDGVIFHELAHQKLYVKDDTAFNESYASFVQEQGLREWRAARGLAPPDERSADHDAAFTRLVLDLRERLRALYARNLPVEAARAAKRDEIAAFRVRYAHLRDEQWGRDTRWDSWVAASINNARLVSFGLYQHWVPAFARLFEEAGRRWPVFYASVGELARLPKGEREVRLLELSPAAATPEGERVKE